MPAEDEIRFYLDPDADDEVIEHLFAAPEYALVRREEETEPLADLFAELTGDPAWAASFSADLAQLDRGSNGLLTPEEQRALLRSLAAAQGEQGFSIAELHALFTWANNARIMHDLLDLVLDGDLLARIGPEGPVFTAPE